MTKNNLVKKILNYALPTALAIGSAFYSSNANAQAVDNGKGPEQGKFKQEMIFNAYDVAMHLRKLEDKSGKKTDQERIRLYPGTAVIISNEADATNPNINKIVPILSYKIVDNQEFNAIEYKPNEEEKKMFDDFLKEKGITGNTTKLSPDEEKRLFHTLHEENSAQSYSYFPISLKADTTHLDSAFHKGTNLGIVIPQDGKSIVYKKTNLDREIVYLIGHPCGLKALELDVNEKDVSPEEFNDYKVRLDSLDRKFLSSEKIRENYEDENLFKGKALNLLNLPYLKKEENCGGDPACPPGYIWVGEKCAPKTPSKFEGRANVEFNQYLAGMKGNYGMLSLQAKVGKDLWAGVFGFDGKGIKGLEEILEINSNGDKSSIDNTTMYIQPAGQFSDKRNIILKSAVGVLLSYNPGNWELDFGLGLANQKIKQNIDYSSAKVNILDKNGNKIGESNPGLESVEYSDKKFGDPLFMFGAKVYPLKIAKIGPDFTKSFYLSANGIYVPTSIKAPFDNGIKDKGYSGLSVGAGVDLIDLSKKVFGNKNKSTEETK